MVVVALVSVLLLSGVNYVFARGLLVNSVEVQMETLRDTRVESIGRSIDRVEAAVSTLALTPSVIAAMGELAAGYHDIDVELTADQRAELGSTVTETLDDAGATASGFDAASVMPASLAGRYVQYHYIAASPYDFDARDGLDDAGDGSEYSAAHAAFHPLLRALAANIQMSDLMLVDAETRDVVYTTKKRIDLGTNVSTGPWSNSALGEIIDRLADAPIGDAVISDTSLYVPAHGRPVIFLATAIRDGSNVIGALVTELPVEALTNLVTANDGWEALGLGATGDVYLVGSDGTLRTDPRGWSDDPKRFLERTGDDRAISEAIERTGSPVLLQRVDNDAVETALTGHQFLGTVDNALGEATLAASGSVVAGDLDWVVVVEQTREETTRSLRHLMRATLLVMTILLPLTALLAWWLARVITRPFEVLMAQAAGIARAEPSTAATDLGRNELGDLGRQLDQVARRLAAEERALAIEEQHIMEVLAAVVPPRLIESVRRGDERVDDLVDIATVISISIDGLTEREGSDHDGVVEVIGDLSDELDLLTARHGVETVRRSTTGALFVAGLGADEIGVTAAAQFAVDAVALVSRVGDEHGRSATVRVGLAVGEVATGVIGRKQLTFSMWGDAVATAVTLASLAAPGTLLADVSVVEQLDDTWSAEPAGDAIGITDFDARVISQLGRSVGADGT